MDFLTHESPIDGTKNITGVHALGEPWAEHPHGIAVYLQLLQARQHLQVLKPADAILAQVEFGQVTEHIQVLNVLDTWVHQMGRCGAEFWCLCRPDFP